MIKMKKLITGLFSIASFVIFADTQYRLKSDVYADMIDENGIKIRSGRIRAGTKIIIIQDDTKAEAVKNTRRKVKYIAPKMFMATMPKMQPVKYSKCECKISTDFYGEFENCQKSHWAICIFAYTDDGEDYEMFLGYVRRTSAISNRLMKLLSDGKEHVLSLVVQYTDKAIDNDVLEIIGFNK